MASISRLFLLGAVAVAAPASAESNWEFVSDVKYPSDPSSYIAQIDANSIRTEGNSVSYWLRVMKLDFNGPKFDFPLRAGPALYQDDCASNRFRVVQGNIIWGYEGPSIPLSRPAGWQFVAPDSLAESAHKYACRKRALSRPRKH